MSDTMTITGIVAEDPRHTVKPGGLAITSFRLASGQRRFDRPTQSWVDGETNWYTVSAFRHLAFNLARSLHKGDHVLVTGRLRIRNWENGERRGTAVELEADTVGHDLFWCTTTAVRSGPTPAGAQRSGVPVAAPAADPQAAPQPASGWADPQLDSRPLGSDGFMPAGGGDVRELADVDS